MSEILVGDVLARLRMDVSQFNQAIADVLQRLQQLNQASAQARTMQAQGQQSTAQLAQATTALNSAVAAQTQATTQASGAQRSLVQAVQQNTQAATQAASAHKGVAQAVTQTTQAATQATQATTQSTAALRAQQTALQQTTQAAGGASSALQGMLAIAGGIGVATGIGALAGQLKDFAVSAVDVATRMQSLRASLSALAGDAAAGQQQFAQLFATAQSVGVAFEPLARGFRQLTAAATQAGLPLSDQQRLLAAMAREAKVTGASSEELGRGILALAQMASKGKVSMEELRQQLGESMVRAMAEVARGMGVTTEALIKMVETGTVDFVPFAKAYTRGMEEMQAASGKFADGGREAFNRLGNAFTAFKDALGTNVLPELERLAKIATGILDTATALLALAGGKRDPRLAPNTASEIVGTPDEEREIARLRAVVERLNQQAATAVPGPLREQREGMAKRAQEELDTRIELVQAKKDEAAADAQGTAEINKSSSARERQVAFVEQLTKALDEADKKAEEFRQKAAIAPEREGRLGGTFEEAQKYRKGLAEATGKELDRLAEVIRTKAADTTVPADLQSRFDAQRKGYAGIETAIKSADEAEKARLKTIRETEQAREKAARDAIAAEKAAVTQAIQLDSTLERLRGMTRKPDENKAEEAATRVRSQYAGAIAEAEKAIVELERSAALRAKRPEALEQYRELVKALREAGEAQAKLASDEVLKQQIKPLEEIALRYGAVTLEITSQSDHVQELASKYGLATKEAIDLAKAEELAASFTGTARQEAAEKYLKTIRDTIEARQEIEAKVPELEQQAQASFGPGLAAVRGVAVTSDLERQLELLRTPREERASTRARQKAERASGGVLTDEQEALIRQIEAQERVNKITQMAEQIGDQAAQTITSGLLKIVDGTVRVGEGFRNMAKEILDSIAEITLNETFKTLIRFGLGLATTALTGALTPAAAESGPSTLGPSSSFIGGILGSQFESGFQHGGVVNRPTHAMLGENPGMNPEFIVNHPQMKALMSAAMQAAPSAGGQAAGGDVSVILVDNRGQAEREAAAQRGMGRQVIIQEVVRDLSQGSGSTIGRMIKAGGH